MNLKPCYVDVRMPGGQLVRRVTACADDDFILAITNEQAKALRDLIDPEIAFLRQQVADKGPLTRIAHPLDDLTDIIDQIEAQCV